MIQKWFLFNVCVRNSEGLSGDEQPGVLISFLQDYNDDSLAYMSDCKAQNPICVLRGKD